jgi:hypothetical protein
MRPAVYILSMDIVKCETDISMIRFTVTGKAAITYRRPARRLFLYKFKHLYAIFYK